MSIYSYMYYDFICIFFIMMIMIDDREPWDSFYAFFISYVKISIVFLSVEFVGIDLLFWQSTYKY